jgi:predicted nucleic acid-binding Zn ribbon protein
MADDPVSLEESLDTVVRSLRGAGARATAGVFGQWEEVVGPLVAAHARPSLLDEGRLVVDVDQPGWATQLRYLETDLLARLASVAGAGAIRTIEVRVRPFLTR